MSMVGSGIRSAYSRSHLRIGNLVQNAARFNFLAPRV
jgi:hypothetical protein